MTTIFTDYGAKVDGLFANFDARDASASLGVSLDRDAVELFSVTVDGPSLIIEFRGTYLPLEGKKVAEALAEADGSPVVIRAWRPAKGGMLRKKVVGVIGNLCLNQGKPEPNISLWREVVRLRKAGDRLLMKGEDTQASKFYEEANRIAASLRGITGKTENHDVDEEE